MTQTIVYPISVLRRTASTRIAAATRQGAAVLDVTSKGQQPWMQFSPFYPHRNIPVPMSEGYVSASVEGVWQGLKVFESEGIDRSKLRVVTMKGLKRTVRTHGRVLGHQAGINPTRPLLGKVEARRELYLPAYRWVLEHKLGELVEQIRQMRAARPIVLLDYETNADVFDASSPLSHAQLVKAYIEDRWPA